MPVKRLVFISLLALAPSWMAAQNKQYKLGDVPTEEEKNRKQKTPADPEAERPGKASSTTGTDSAHRVKDGAEDFYQKGIKALNAKKYEEAEAWFDQTLVLNPKHAGARAGINRVMKEYEKDSRQAKPIRKKQVLPAPKEGKNVQVKPAEREKNLKAARQKSEEVYLEALKISQAGGPNEDAIDLCRQALALDPNNLQAQRMMDRLQGKIRRR